MELKQRSQVLLIHSSSLGLHHPRNQFGVVGFALPQGIAQVLSGCHVLSELMNRTYKEWLQAGSNGWWSRTSGREAHAGQRACVRAVPHFRRLVADHGAAVK